MHKVSVAINHVSHVGCLNVNIRTKPAMMDILIPSGGEKKNKTYLRIIISLCISDETTVSFKESDTMKTLKAFDSDK